MIMAGRGRRILGSGDMTGQLGAPKSPTENSITDVPTLLKTIDEIDVNHTNPSVLSNIQNSIGQIFTTKEIMKDVLSNSHTKALGDAEFGEKLVVALEQVSNFEIGGSLLRGELLSFIQDDFKAKETWSQSDPKKFVNAVHLLGNVYNRIKVCGKPIEILGSALLEYFDLLIKGEEEELKALCKQIFLNGNKLLNLKKFETLKCDLRSTLTSKNLSVSSKCWILLAIDFISTGLKPLNGVVRDFYVTNLGEQYVKLESIIQSDHFNSSLPKIKGQSSAFMENQNLESSHTDDLKISEKFSGMGIKSEKDKKKKSPMQSGKSNKKDFWKSPTGSKGNMGHDDRFEKDEHFYGVQKPRQLKSENPKKSLNEVKGNKKGLDNSNTGFDAKLESSPKQTENES